MGVKKARIVASTAIGQLIEDRGTSVEQQRQIKLTEARQVALGNPDYAVLKVNLNYQKWLKGELKPREGYVTSSDPTYLFPEIATGKPINPLLPAAWKEQVVDPKLSEADLHLKCVEYCAKTAQEFVGRATEIAESFAGADYSSDVGHMTNAIGDLIGVDPDNDDKTVFKDQSWSAAVYTPDHIRLGVDFSEIDVPQEKIMAGVGLCIGLWVRLADADAKRPISGHNFAPPFEHCSFGSLVMDTGWADYTNMNKLFRGSFTPGEEQELFLAPFRDPQFFEDTLADLK